MSESGERRAESGASVFKTQLASTARAGQVLLAVIFSVLVLCIAVLWIADLHFVVLAKDKSQNAGDAAALEGARWQAATLNLEGELNLLGAFAIATKQAGALDAITNLAKRLAYCAPLAGAAAEQQAAKLNGIPVNDDFTQEVRDHASEAADYGARLGANGEPALPEPWPGAWGEYAAMLRALADEGIAAGFDNASYFGMPNSNSHYLAGQDFYLAVRARDWCWFHRNAPDLLKTWRTYQDWDPLPDANDRSSPDFAEYLPLQIAFADRRLQAVAAIEPFRESLENTERLGAVDIGMSIGPDWNPLLQRALPWVYYRSGSWSSWDVMRDPAFPLSGTLRDEYDYWGADNVARVSTDTTRLTSPKATDTMVWVAAAKPFGSLSNLDGGPDATPCAVPVVLPVFHDVRLVPLDASTGGGGGAFDLAWRRHVVEHLPPYMARGVSALVPNCKWCSALEKWNPQTFRDDGTRWLSTNTWKCTIVPHGPGGSHGGSRHAH